MGINGVINHGAPLHTRASDGVTEYGWLRGTENGPNGDILRHAPTVTRAQMSAIIDAAQVSQAAWQAHVQQNHPALYSWLMALPSPERVARYNTDRLTRDL
jgi:hypothetical protein